MNTATQMVADWFYSTDEHAAMARSIVAKLAHAHITTLAYALEAAITANLTADVNSLTSRLIKFTLEQVDWQAVARDVRANA